jgi:hypothetical protein
LLNRKDGRHGSWQSAAIEMSFCSVDNSVACVTNLSFGHAVFSAICHHTQSKLYWSIDSTIKTNSLRSSIVVTNVGFDPFRFRQVEGSVVLQGVDVEVVRCEVPSDGETDQGDDGEETNFLQLDFPMFHFPVF